MKLKNPLNHLLLLVLANALAISAVCVSTKSQVPQPEERTKILALCAIAFLSTASIASWLGNTLLRSFIEPIEESQSKMLSLLDEPETKSESESDLSSLTDKLINALETARQREKLIADYSSDILCSLDDKRRLLDLNIQSESILEYPIISLLATPLDSLILAEDREEYLQYFDACKQQEQSKPLECRLLSRSGKAIDLEWQVEWSPSLQRYYCLAKNISDRKETQRLKAEITAMVGHDLRAPASSLSFLLANLSSGTFGKLPAEAESKVEKAGDNVACMLKLINQLLDAEKLDGGKMEVELKIIPLSELYETCTGLVYDLAEKCKVTINFPQESELLAMADFDKAVQILCNLLSNAIKWSEAGSSVDLKEIADGKTVTIQVIDRGPGIAPERQKSIFERFKSLDQRENKTIASTGLGLYIAKKLIELQGGQIGLETEVGKGSTFFISLKQASENDLPGYLE